MNIACEPGRERSAAAIVQDIREGKLTARAAQEHYSHGEAKD